VSGLSPSSCFVRFIEITALFRQETKGPDIILSHHLLPGHVHQRCGTCVANVLPLAVDDNEANLRYLPSSVLSTLQVFKRRFRENTRLLVIRMAFVAAVERC